MPFNKLFRFFSITLHLGGGFAGVIKKVIRLYRRNGFSGVWYGLKLIYAQCLPDPTIGSDHFDRNDYTEWVKRYDTVTPEIKQLLASKINNFIRLPLISIVMPTYNSKPEWLKEAIDSVIQQIYPNWELCIADDASSNQEFIYPTLKSYAEQDKRIKVIFCEQNGHISTASNKALSLASGEWVVLLDHDDVLSAHALFWIVDTILNYPEVQLIYSDEDKLDEYGNRSVPYFKCDWNQDLFYSHNMFCHLGAYRTSLIHKIGGFRTGFEGAQDYDLTLRCIEHIRPNQIQHIPRLLYHWRVHSDSTSKSLESKPYAISAGERALNEHFSRQKVNAKATFEQNGYRIQYGLPERLPLVSIIVNINSELALVRQCVQSILNKTTYHNYEILIIDNEIKDTSVRKYLEHVQKNGHVRIISYTKNTNHAKLNNETALQAQGDVITFINTNISVISPLWLTEMVSVAIQSEVGIVGTQLWYPNHHSQHSGIILGIDGWIGHAHKGFSRSSNGYIGRMAVISGFSAVSGDCFSIQKSVFTALGGLDDVNLQSSCTDIDLCLRARSMGYRNVWTPYAEMYYHESELQTSYNSYEYPYTFIKESEYVKKKWATFFLNDPAYNPNLTLEHEDFSLAWPPRLDPIN
ncbi:glycosyltransferase family 2 protein [Aquirhabdus sp.]|uniref:glycosyltransferase family 2 protein n=1 Tax=Aquirhabdus sp. TaxID=2824160 RepID=UPI00396C8542